MIISTDGAKNTGVTGARTTLKQLPLLLIVATLAAGLGAPISAAQLTYAEAINKAGRQRMLTQRITKSYCLVGMVVDPLVVTPKHFEEQLQDAVQLFEAQLGELKAFPASAQIKIALEDVSTQWGSFKPLALSKPTRENVTRLWQLDEELLQASEKVVRLLQDAAGTSYGPLVNISGRQRMLSQRIAKFYAMSAWGLATPSMLATMEQAKNEFKGALDTLKNAPENTLAISKKLEEVDVQWGWLNSALDLHDKPSFPMIVNDTSEKTLRLMDAVTRMYEKATPAH
jgi:hypothetical protein